MFVLVALLCIAYVVGGLLTFGFFIRVGRRQWQRRGMQMIAALGWPAYWIVFSGHTIAPRLLRAAGYVAFRLMLLIAGLIAIPLVALTILAVILLLALMLLVAVIFIPKEAITAFISEMLADEEGQPA